MPSFRKAYNTYKKLEKKGLTSVHGSSLEIYNYLTQNKVDSAFALAAENYDRFGHEAAIYEWIGDWENAYSIMKKDMAETDSINAVILSNSMEGIQNELDLFEYEQKLARQRIIILTGLVCILVLVIITMVVYNVIRRRNIRRLEEARDRALESDRMKSAFINNVSHEIRTPLNIISGFSQVMATSHNEMEDAERMRLVRLIYKNTELIVSLVDEMLDLSMAESSNSLECKDLVVINEMCHSVLEKYADRKNDNVEILFTSNVDDEYKILSHKYILPKVINALVDNAVKYTDEGTVSLKVQLLQKSIVFVVEDTGRGIPAAEAERIFDRFEKLDTFMSGLGLGLTLARALAARLDGTITLDTTYNEGARFQVEFPLK
jgi:signal transduction histidine kinase